MGRYKYGGALATLWAVSYSVIASPSLRTCFSNQHPARPLLRRPLFHTCDCCRARQDGAAGAVIGSQCLLFLLGWPSSWGGVNISGADWFHAQRGSRYVRRKCGFIFLLLFSRETVVRGNYLYISGPMLGYWAGGGRGACTQYGELTEAHTNSCKLQLTWELRIEIKSYPP